MNPITIHITSTRPFGNGFLNFNANTDTGPIEGIVWDKEIQPQFQPGANLTVTVGAQKSDGAFWNNYKGKNRLEINKSAQITAAAAPAATQAAPAQQAYQAPQYQAPAIQQPTQAPQQAHPPTTTAPHDIEPLDPGLEQRFIETSISRGSRLYHGYIANGLPPEAAAILAGAGQHAFPLQWCGKKGSA